MERLRCHGFRTHQGSIALSIAFTSLLLLCQRCTGDSVVVQQFPADCSANASFDTSSLTCTACAANSQQPSSSGIGCSCAPGYALQYSNLSGVPVAYTCAQCPANRVPSSTGQYCVLCDTTTGATRAASGQDCTCASGELMEFDVTGAPYLTASSQPVKKCQACPANSWLDSTTGTCQPCSYPLVVGADGKSCACPSGLNATEARCFPSTAAAYSQAAAQFGVAGQLPGTSALQELLRSSVVSCLLDRNTTGCNAVANLCTLGLYNSGLAACQWVQQLNSTGVMPSIQYSEPAASVLFPATNDIQTRMSFSSSLEPYSGGATSRLTFVLSATALDGTWLGYSNVSTQLQLCGGRTDQLADWQTFGRNYMANCTLDWDFIANAGASPDAPVFYDLFLLDGPGRLYRVPVVVQNVPSLLVSRFFLVDTMSGPASTALTYLQDLKLAITLRNSDRARIYPPQLTLLYTTIQASQRQADPAPEYTASFWVVYSLDAAGLASFWSGWRITLIVFLVLAGLGWAARVTVLLRKRRNEAIDGEALLFSAVAAAEVAGPALAAVLALVAWYWCAFYKLQSAVQTMVIQDSETGPFRVVLAVALACQAVAVAALVARQTSYDIFFIDWEKPRRVVSRGGGREEPAPVSCWRTLFVANEWNELQAERITLPAFSLVLLAFILDGLHVDRAGNVTPSHNLSDRQYLQSSCLLRFGVAAGVFIIIVVAQVLFKRLLYHPYVRNPLSDFVDLLFLANISAVILDDRYSGYYIHGRNQTQFSDTNLQDLNASLLKEEEGLVADRGLVPSDRLDIKENQTFQLYIPRKLREKYESRMLRLIQQGAANQRMRAGYAAAVLRGPARPQERTVNSRDELSADFKAMISQVENNAVGQVVEPGFLQRALQLPPPLAAAKPVLAHDFRASFAATSFYGAEARLALLDLLVFLMVDMHVKNSTLAAGAAYFVWLLVRWLRQKLGENNLSRKSLVDPHFLL